MLKPNFNLNEIKESLKDISDEVAVNLILTGSAAKKMLLLRQIMITAFPDLTEESIYKYILTSGINRELEKFAEDD
jgi:hypothetical protein